MVEGRKVNASSRDKVNSVSRGSTLIQSANQSSKKVRIKSCKEIRDIILRGS